MIKNKKWTILSLGILCVLGMCSSTGCRKKEDPPPGPPPQVSFISPILLDGYDTISRDVNIDVSAQAVEDKYIEKIEFYVDGVLLPGGTVTEPPFQYQWEVTDQFGVFRKITVVAYDSRGVSASTSVEVKIFNGVEKAPMPTTRYAFSSDVVNNKIFVIGGFDFHFNLMEEYDPATDTWTAKTPSNFPHAAHASCVINGQIYVFGGGTDQKLVTDVEAYDPATDTWTTKSPIPIEEGASMSLSSCAVVNGKAYLMGGLADPGPARVAEYDPGTDSWRMTNSLMQEYSAEALNLNDILYFIGGCPDRSMGVCANPSNAFQAYDPIADTWTSHPSMNLPYSGHCATEANGKIYVMGGTEKGSTAMRPGVEVYDPASDSWASLPNMPEGLVNFGCNTVNGLIYIIGSEHVYEYSPD